MSRFRQSLGAAFVLGTLLPILAASPLDYWTTGSPTPTGNNLFSIAVGNGKFVAIGEWGTVLTSKDGVHWKDHSLPVPMPIMRLAFGGGTFVAHAIDGLNQANGQATLYLLASRDGESWTVTHTRSAKVLYGRTEILFDIIYADGLFVAVGGNESFVLDERTCLILTSADGTNWTTRVSQPAKALYAITHAQGRFVAVGQQEAFMVSTNGLDWAADTDQTIGYWPQMDVVWFGGRYVSVASGFSTTGPTHVYTSTNGTDWRSDSTITFYGDLRCIVPYGDGLLALGEAGKAFWSKDLIEWTQVESPSQATIFCAETIQGKAYVLGSRGLIAIGQNHEPWTKAVRYAGTNVFRGTTYGMGRFVAVGYKQAAYSDDGVNWFPSTDQPTNKYLNSVAYGGGHFVTVGHDHAIGVSTNGDNWNYSVESAVGPALLNIVWDGNEFLAAGDSGVFATTNGINWRTVAYDRYVYCVVSSGNFRVMSRGTALMVCTNTESTEWTVVTNTMPSLMWDGTYGNGRFVLVGDRGDAWSSTNGFDWVLAKVRPSWALNEVEFIGDRFVAAGVGGFVFSSVDGIFWEQHLVASPNQIFGLAHGHDRLVLAGVGTLLVSDPLSSAVRTVREFARAENGKLRLSLLTPASVLVALQVSNDMFDWRDLDLFLTPLGRSIYEVEANDGTGFYRAWPLWSPQNLEAANSKAQIGISSIPSSSSGLWSVSRFTDQNVEQRP